MADGAKNVGQVAGIWIGNVAPENTNIIWFDTNTSERRHKVYDFGQMKWVTLNPQIVVPTTYNELVNTARQSGLSVGSMYKLTDMSNVLAYAITTTKVQYNDNKGNIIVDDLGTGKEYHVSSSNLLIDGVQGVFDTATNQLLFSFAEDSLDEDVYLFGKKKVNNVWRLVKAKISALISSDEGNSITWKHGLFFSFNSAISAILNKRGGVVGKTAYDKDMEEIAQDIENVGKENQRILKTAKDYTDEKTTDDAIFGKKLTDDIADAQPIDVKKNMTLKDIVANFQRWLTRLRWATGIKLTRSFTNARTFQWVNNNDTVESAFGKVQYILQNFTDTLTIPGDFVQNDGMTDEQYIKDEKFRNQTLRNTFAMIIGFIYNIANHSRMKELDMTTERATDEKELRRELNYLERNTAEDGPNSIITYSRKIYYMANTSSGIDELSDAMGLPTNIKVKYRNNLVAYDQWLEGSYIRFGVSGPIIALVDTGTITNETPGVYVKSVSPNEDGISVDVEWGYNAAYDGEGHEIPVIVPGSDVCSIYVKFNYLDIPREQLLQIPIKRLFPGQDMDAEDVGINITIGKALELIINYISNLSTNAHIGDDIRVAINNSSESNEDKIIEDLKAVTEYGINVSFGKALKLIINYIANSQDNIHIWLSHLNNKRELDEGGLIQEAECEREDLADSLAEFMKNIIEFLLNAANNIHLNDDFEIAEDMDDQTAATPAYGDSINDAFAKLGGWFNDLTKHIVFDTWEYSKVTFEYSEQEIVDLKDKSLYAVMQLVASYLEDTWGNAHMNREHLTLPTVTDEADLIEQLEHKTGADAIGINIYDAIGLLASFVTNGLDTIHMPDDYSIENWETIRDFSIYTDANWQGASLKFVLSKLISLFVYGSRKIDISDTFANNPNIVDETFLQHDELKGNSIETALAKIVSFLLNVTEHGHLGGTIKSYTITDEDDLIEQLNHTTGADAIRVSILEAISIIARFCTSIPTSSHLADDWTPEADPTQASLATMQSLSLSDAIKRLAGIVLNAASILKLADDWTPEVPGEGESLAQSGLSQMQSFTFSDAFSRIAAILLDWSNILLTASDQSYQGSITDAEWVTNMHDRSAKEVLSYILGYIKDNTSAARLPSSWAPKAITSNISLPAVGDNIDDAVAKIVGKLEQIGDISQGYIQSKTTDSDNRRNTYFNINGGSLNFNNSPYAMNLNYDKIQIDKNGSSYQRFYASDDQMLMYANSPSYYDLWVSGMPSWWGIYGIASFISNASNSFNTGAVLGSNTNGNEKNFGGIFTSVMIGGLTLDCLTIGGGQSVTLTKFVSCVMALTKSEINITLPAAPPSGRTIYIIQGGSEALHIHANGNDHIDRRGGDPVSSKDIDFNIRGAIFTFTYVSGVSYEQIPVDGLWFVSYASAL